ncbi:MAG: hypothetical protein ABIG44_08170 [Planctomycetota bacterium]
MEKDRNRRAYGGSTVSLVTESDVEEYLKLKQLVEEAADDVYKAVGGNKAAGTRVRKAMQDIKNTAQDVRKRILNLRESDETAESTPTAE